MMNIFVLEDKLKFVLCVIVDIFWKSISVDFIDIEVLYWIVVMEGLKVYYKKNVDEENKYGFFLVYKMFCGKIVDIIKEIKLVYFYFRVLASMLLELVNNNIYFVEYLFCLMDIKFEVDYLDWVVEMLFFFVFGCF